MELSKLKHLPIISHFDEGQIVKSNNPFKKGEKGMYNIMKLLIFGTILYFSWVYVLPAVFIAIGKFFAIASTLVLVGVFIIALPVILKGIRRFTKMMHKNLIKIAPFDELYDQKNKMIQNEKSFIKSQGKIDNLRQQMEVGAKESEDKAKTLSSKILTLAKKSNKLKDEMESLVKKNGASAKGEDEYVNKLVTYQKVLSDGQRTKHLLTQEQSFISKYGTRAHIMKKLSHKLKLVGMAMSIKIDDLQATIEILEKDYNFARETRLATEAAKSAMMFKNDWEFDYAMDVVTSTIAQDIAISTANINDIDKYTTQYSLDSDELYANLNLVADEIRIGKDPIKSARDYSSESYELTHEDKLNAGGFPTVF